MPSGIIHRMGNLLTDLVKQVRHIGGSVTSTDAKTPNLLFGQIDPFLAIGFASTAAGSPVRRVVALGNNPDIDTGTVPEDIWTGGGLYPWITTAAPLEIVSNSADDTAAGTGARTVLVIGLNASYAEIQELVTLNGTTPVPLVNQFFRIFTAAHATAGSSGINAGTINIRDVTGGTVRAIIPAGYGITRQSQYTVPAGYTLQVVSLFFSINRPSGVLDATIATLVRSSSGTYRLPFELSIDGNPYRHDGLPGIGFAEKTDFGLRCTFASGNNMDLTGAFLGVLMRNDYVAKLTYT